jgi:hypothetical protein
MQERSAALGWPYSWAAGGCAPGDDLGRRMRCWVSVLYQPDGYAIIGIALMAAVDAPGHGETKIGAMLSERVNTLTRRHAIVPPLPMASSHLSYPATGCSSVVRQADICPPVQRIRCRLSPVSGRSDQRKAPPAPAMSI